jgi:hypothetical protein
MGWHLKWVDMSISLVSVWHWRLMGVDHQNITQLKSSWEFHFAMTSCHVKSIAWLFWWTLFLNEWYWWIKYCMHFQLYFNFNHHYLYPTHILPTHLPITTLIIYVINTHLTYKVLPTYRYLEIICTKCTCLTYNLPR